MNTRKPAQRFLACLTMVSALCCASAANAGLSFDDSLLDQKILGGRLLVHETGEVTATFLGSDAGFFNTLHLASPSDFGPWIIFHKWSRVGHTMSLGSYEAGTELIFRIMVWNTWNSFYTGDADRNIDLLPHAEAVTSLVDGEYITTVGFEDLLGGGDQDYNDFMFSLTNVVDPPPGAGQVPAPGPLALLGLGLTILGLTRRR